MSSYPFEIKIIIDNLKDPVSLGLIEYLQTNNIKYRIDSEDPYSNINYLKQIQMNLKNEDVMKIVEKEDKVYAQEQQLYLEQLDRIYQKIHKESP
jgi:hypothetical protein